MNKIKNNEVMIGGSINGEAKFNYDVFGEKFYRIELKVERNSDAADFIPLIVSERLCDVSELKKGVFVSVQGSYRSYNKRLENRNQLLLSVFVSELKIENEETNPNNIHLEGYVCKPPIYRKTPLGREIADLLIAVNRPYGKSDYIPCIAWGRNARYASTFKVGGYVQIQGRIQSREYMKKIDEEKSEKRVAYEVSVGKIEYIDEVKDEQISKS